MALLAFRILVTSGFEECINVYNSNKLQEIKDARYNGSDYKSVFLQVDNIESRDPGDTFRSIVTSLFLAHFLNKVQTNVYFQTPAV